MSLTVGQMIDVLKKFDNDAEFLLEGPHCEEIEINESDVYEVGNVGIKRVLLYTNL